MLEPSVLTPETSLSLTVISQISPSICQNKSKWSIFNFREELNQIVIHTGLNPKDSLLLLGWSWHMCIQIDLPISSGITKRKTMKAILDGRRVSGDKISQEVFLFLWKKSNFSYISFSCFSPHLSFLFEYGNVFWKAHTQAAELIPNILTFWIMAGVKQGSQICLWETKDSQMSKEQVLRVPVL